MNRLPFSFLLTMLTNPRDWILVAWAYFAPFSSFSRILPCSFFSTFHPVSFQITAHNSSPLCRLPASRGLVTSPSPHAFISLQTHHENTLAFVTLRIKAKE